MTSLSQQLQKLAAPQTDVYFQRKSKASILFDGKEAASYSRDDFYEIGITGFWELVQIDSKFLRFEEELFSSRAKEIQRTVESKEFNKRLSQTIEEYLLCVSPYLEKTASLKSIEWLIHRMMIEKMDTESLLMCIFPYYETSLFARILQVLHFEGNSWPWLQALKKNNVPLPKDLLFSAWESSKTFRNFILTYMEKVNKILDNSSEMKAANSFAITTQVGGLNSVSKMSEDHIQYVMQWVLNKRFSCSNNNELASGTNFLLLNILVTTKLKESALAHIFASLIKTKSSLSIDEIAMTLTTLFNHQKVQQLPANILKFLVANFAIIKNMASFSSTMSVAFNFTLLLDSIFKCKKISKESHINKWPDLISSMTLTATESSIIIGCLLRNYIDNGMRSEELLSFLNAFQSSHPKGYLIAINKLINDNKESTMATKLYLKVITECMAENSNIVAVQSDSIHIIIKLHTIQNFLNTYKQDNSQADHLLSLLMEEDPRVIELLFQHGDILLKAMGITELFEECICFLKKYSGNQNSDTQLQLTVLSFMANSLMSQVDFSMQILIAIQLYKFVAVNTNKATQSLISNLDTTTDSLYIQLLHKCSSQHNKKALVTNVFEALPKLCGVVSTSKKNAIVKVAKERHELDCLETFILLLLLQAMLKRDEYQQHFRIEVSEAVMGICKKAIKGFKINIGTRKTRESDIELSKGIKSCIEPNLNVLQQDKLPYKLLVNLFNSASHVVNLNEPQHNSHKWLLCQQYKGCDASSLKLLHDLLEMCLLMMLNYSQELALTLLKTILKDKLHCVSEQLYFLAYVWLQPVDGKNKDFVESKKLWCIRLAYSLLAKQKLSNSSSTKVSGTEEVVSSAFVASLLFVVLSGGACVRGAFEVIGLLHSTCLQSQWHPILDVLTYNQADIEANVCTLPSFMSVILMNGKKGTKLQSMIADCICDDLAPMQIKNALLYAISDVENDFLLEQLLPFGLSILSQIECLPKGSLLDEYTSMSLYYICKRLNDKAKVALTQPSGQQFVCQLSQIHCEVLLLEGETVSPHELVSSHKLLKSLHDKSIKVQVTSSLLSHALDNETSKGTLKVKKEIIQSKFDADELVHLMDSLKALPKVLSIKEARALKKAKKSSSSKLCDKTSESQGWRKLGLLLELIGVMPTIDQPWKLIHPLCRYLQETFVLESSQSDLLVQQILNLMHTLLKLCMETIPKDIGILVELNIPLVVRCLRESHNPDTHRRALIILANAAQYFPDRVLQNIMCIFTFMGSSLLRKDDSFSFQVIHQTIDSIIPIVIKDANNDPNQLLLKLSRVTQVFVDALPDVAEHRRLALFTQLANTLGVTQYLWLLVVLIADRYVIKQYPSYSISAAKKSSLNDTGNTALEIAKEQSRDIQFALLLYTQFTVEEQLQAVLETVKFISILPEDKDAFMESKPSENFTSFVIDIKTHNSKQLRVLKYSCAGLLASLITAQDFKNQASDATLDSISEECISFENHCLNIVQHILLYITRISHQQSNESPPNMIRFWSALHRKLIDVLDAIVTLLPSSTFASLIAQLINSESQILVTRALEMLATKLQPPVHYFGSNDSDNLIQLLPLLQDIVTTPSSQNTTQNLPSKDTRQAALLSLHLLVWFLSRQSCDPQVFIPLVQPMLSVTLSNDESLVIRSQCVLVLCECVGELKAHLLPHLKSFMQVLFSLLHQSQAQHDVHDSQMEQAIIAAITAMCKLLENIPQFMSPFLPSILRVVCNLVLNQETLSKESRVLPRVCAIRLALTKQVSPKAIIPTMQKLYAEFSEQNSECLSVLVSLVDQLVKNAVTNDLVAQSKALLALFKTMFDFRSTQTESPAVEEVENSAIAAVCEFLLKLTEEQNSSFFKQLLMWVKEAQDEAPLRTVTFFRFSGHMAHVLKQLYIQIKFAHLILPFAAEVLHQNNRTLNSETIFGNSPENDEYSCQLVTAVIDNLAKIFHYGDPEFMDIDNFNLVLKPLANQIENTIGPADSFETRVKDHLVPCFTSLAKVCHESAMWKEITLQVVTRMNLVDNQLIVLSAIDIFDDLIENLGEDYLQVVVADALPFVTELFETPHEQVEIRAKELFQKMSGLLGETLHTYLQE